MVGAPTSSSSTAWPARASSSASAGTSPAPAGVDPAASAATRSSSRSFRTVCVDATTGRLADVAALVASGVLSTRVAGSYPLDDAVTAYTRLAKGGVRGRLVLVP